MTEEQKAKRRARYLKYAAEHPEKILEAKRRYAAKNAEKLKEKALQKRLANPELYRKRSADYAAANRDKVRENHLRHRQTAKYKETVTKYSKEYYEKNKDHIAQRGKNYRAKNPEKVAKQRRLWLEKNRHKIHEYNHTRRARKAGQTDPEALLEANKLVRKWRRQESHSCTYCGENLTSVTLVIDHVFPLAKGGTHSVDNIVVSCKSCNSSKGAKLLFTEWVPEFIYLQI